MKRDKTFYTLVDGKVIRVRAPQKPDAGTQEAIAAMVKAAMKLDLQKADRNKFPKSFL